jgi:two-component system, chemotaxis family, protein-glutamate methylesterase/glutaminase
MGPRTRAVFIGGSAGALEALLAMLPELPAGFSLPLLIVVHLAPRRGSLIAEVLQARCRIRVREAEDKDVATPGTAYFAPPDYHMLIEADGRISLSIEAPVQYSRPSIDVLFESAADAYGALAIGVVLSGANNDGARGLAAIVRAGGTAVVQRPEEATSAAMPAAALAACLNALALGARDIAEFLRKAEL